MNISDFYYIDSNIICIIVLAILLARTVRGVDWQLSQVFFSRVLFYYIIYCAIDIVWTLFEVGVFHGRVFFFITYSLNYVVSSLCAFYWFIYSETVQGNKKIQHKTERIRYAIPLSIVLLLGLIVLGVYEFILNQTFNDPFFIVYYVVTGLTPIFYIFASFIKSIKRIREKKNSDSYNMHIIMGIYPIILFVFSIVQVIYSDVPILCYVIVIALLCVYFRSLDNLISIDALTKLNNRNQLYSYIDRISKDINSEKYLFFIDVDKFKNINDTYGHMEGDNALILVASSLKEACMDYPSRFFIARYGGDEFLIIANKCDINDCNELREKINNAVRQNVHKQKLQYRLTVSVGYSLADFSKRSIEECLKEADEKLYVEKRLKIINTASTF